MVIGVHGINGRSAVQLAMVGKGRDLDFVTVRFQHMEASFVRGLDLKRNCAIMKHVQVSFISLDSLKVWHLRNLLSLVSI